MVKIGAKLAKFWGGFNQDKRSKVLEKILTGSFNAKTQKRTVFDWLAVDTLTVDQYIADEFCGAVFPPSFYEQLMVFLLEISQVKQRANIRKDLPVFIIAGRLDPVGSYGKGIEKLVQQYVGVQLSNIKVNIYEKSRHEILNDIEKAAVFSDIISWLEGITMLPNTIEKGLK
jgi:alpha-beta hydrolase superfamily lysophospholipase